jgi:LysM repeat protein
VPVTTPTNGGSTTVTPPGTGSKPPTGSKPKPPTGSKPKPPTTKAPIKYTVHAGDTLSSIAKKYGTTAQELFTYNTTPGVRPASTIATLKKRGPTLIYSGETILIPQK